MALFRLSLDDVADRWRHGRLPLDNDDAAVKAAVTERRRLLRKARALPQGWLPEFARVCLLRTRDHAVAALRKGGFEEYAAQVEQPDTPLGLVGATSLVYEHVVAEAEMAAALANESGAVAEGLSHRAAESVDAVEDIASPKGVRATADLSAALGGGFEADQAARTAMRLGGVALAARALLFAARVASRGHADATAAATASLCAGLAGAHAAAIDSSPDEGMKAGKLELQRQADWLGTTTLPDRT